MARKPVDLTANARRPQGRQVIWEAMRKLGIFTIGDLEIATRVPQATIRTYVVGLTRAGYLVRLAAPKSHPGDRRYRAGVWRLERDVGVEAPRVTRRGEAVTQGRGREQMWHAMRVIGDFNFRDLAVHASTEEHPVAEGEARHYAECLHRAGYLRLISPGAPGRLARYRLTPTRYTGPQAPMIQRVRQVWDPNEGRVVWRKEAEQGGAA